MILQKGVESIYAHFCAIGFVRWCVMSKAANRDVDICLGVSLWFASQTKGEERERLLFSGVSLDYSGSTRSLHPTPMARFSFVLDVLNSIVVKFDLFNCCSNLTANCFSYKT